MQQPMIVGNPVLVVVDIQNSIGMSRDELGIPTMGGEAERFERAIEIVDGAREAAIPIVFFREVHRRTRVDFGRELDGEETIHCLEDDPATGFAPRLRPRPDEYEIAKRRYSCFFGTDLEILLKGLHADTLILIGGLTDVCVHYTFVDGHQRDYYVRVVEDCVGGSSYPAHEAALAAMEYLQTGARRKTAEILDAFAAIAHAHAVRTDAVAATA